MGADRPSGASPAVAVIDDDPRIRIGLEVLVHSPRLELAMRHLSSNMPPMTAAPQPTTSDTSTGAVIAGSAQPITAMPAKPTRETSRQANPYFR